ncbi:lycopene cyclase domain-containing protein [Brachybacterium muris]|uniref:Lycopene cyclase n=1 Tax=Brachybacterium muris UCD-AY4 TaxID=1249481 RepID=A0A022KYP7_9MICO|nr:lycopene cyclase domain-containing protein [Brachybacterium muris]EYT49644.1 lycopene cyclase [Brachybacterium muris UCD-AY4]MBM7499589.1 lycopene cyclase domain-containing protein [Brachybacterium muris]MCT1431011.1 lycopene cyclase domain-containing protein [Brachybacterium muris]MCT2295094.1 lycopene cyclase domain-containing protein [Brachybacterium muris]
MTYLYVNLAVMGVAIAAAGLALSRVDPRRRRRTLLVSLIAFAVVALLTAVFDTIMIAVGLFTYAEEHLIGWRIGLAPIEDFSYVFVVALLLPALWAFLRRNGAKDDGGPR